MDVLERLSDAIDNPPPRQVAVRPHVVAPGLLRDAKAEIETRRAEVECLKISESLELRNAKAEIERLRAALRDCMSYVDVDNLIMQTKEQEWKRLTR